MATKTFKKLPKKAQRAAFAEMDKDGTRQGNGNNNRVGKLRAATLTAKAQIPKIKALEKEHKLASQKTGKSFVLAGRNLGQGEEQIFAALHENIVKRDTLKQQLGKEISAFKKANATKRSLKVQPRAKTGKLF